MYFNGENGYIKGNSTGFPTGERTVSLMFYLTALETDRGNSPFNYGGNSCGEMFHMVINAKSYSGTYHVQADCDVDPLNFYYDKFPSHQWHHWVIVTDDTSTKMYIDGNLTASNTNPFGPTYVTGREFSIGVSVSTAGFAPYENINTGYFSGAIDEIRVYNRSFNATEVWQRYALDMMLSASPTQIPSQFPSITPTGFPSLPPTNLPSQFPSTSPSRSPITLPTVSPTSFPSNRPTRLPSQFPSPIPTDAPTHVPTIHPVRQNDANTHTEDNPSSWMIPTLLILTGSSWLALCYCAVYFKKQRHHSNNVNAIPSHSGVNMTNLDGQHSNLSSVMPNNVNHSLPDAPKNPDNLLTSGYVEEGHEEEENEEIEEMFEPPITTNSKTVFNIDEEEKEDKNDSFIIRQAKNIIFFPSNELPPKSKRALESKIKSTEQLLDQCYTDNANNEGESDYRKSYPMHTSFNLDSAVNTGTKRLIV